MASDRPGDRGESAERARRAGSGEQRLRPAPTSALSPAPGSLMPVPNPPTNPVPTDDPQRTGPGGPAGRRQHHRPPGGRGKPEAGEDLVYLSGRIPRRLRDELHVRAIGEGRPVVDLMRDALRGYLDQHNGSARP